MTSLSKVRRNKLNSKVRKEQALRVETIITLLCREYVFWFDTKNIVAFHSRVQFLQWQNAFKHIPLQYEAAAFSKDRIPYGNAIRVLIKACIRQQMSYSCSFITSTHWNFTARIVFNYYIYMNKHIKRYGFGKRK